MTSERWRLFVAVPIGDDLRRGLAAAVEEWKKRPDLAGLRWTDPESWHVTVAFLGWTESAGVAAVVDSLQRAAARHEAHIVGTGGLGGFPSLRHARVAWYGINDYANRLAALSRGLAAALSTETRGQFRPHITLARASDGAVDLISWVDGDAAPTGELHVDHVELMRSHPGTRTVHYTSVGSAALAADPSAPDRQV